MENVVIVNPEKLEKIKLAIKKSGAGNLYVLSDFDETLIKAFVNGENIPAMISILYRGNYLPPEYNAGANELFNKYRAIEIDPEVPKKEKKEAMKKWWEAVFGLMIKYGFGKKHVESIVQSPKLELREGFSKMEDFLEENKIPLVILSSNGMGGESISLMLEKRIGRRGNIYVVCNFFDWDENGRAISVKQPIVYTMNKNAGTIKNFPIIFDKIKDRKSIILIGDSLDDIDMVEGFEYDNLIKIGFLNEKTEEKLDNYKKVFDVLILNDGTMYYINKLLEELLN